jgi:hypothetical protein
MEKKKKEFDAVEWVRSVGDANYKRLGHLPSKEYFRTLSSEGKNSRLWKEMDEKADNKKKQA